MQERAMHQNGCTHWLCKPRTGKVKKRKKEKERMKKLKNGQGTDKDMTTREIIKERSELVKEIQ